MRLNIVFKFGRSRLRTCTRKVRYGHKETAEKAAIHMAQKHGNNTFEAYSCKFCDGWHIGKSGL